MRRGLKTWTEQVYIPSPETLLGNTGGRHFLHRFANFIDVAAHAPQDLQRADCNFVSQMERLGEVKLPTGCTQMMLVLPCVPELTPDST